MEGLVSHVKEFGPYPQGMLIRYWYTHWTDQETENYKG